MHTAQSAVTDTVRSDPCRPRVASENAVDRAKTNGRRIHAAVARRCSRRGDAVRGRPDTCGINPIGLHYKCLPAVRETCMPHAWGSNRVCRALVRYALCGNLSIPYIVLVPVILRHRRPSAPSDAAARRALGRPYRTYRIALAS